MSELESAPGDVVIDGGTAIQKDDDSHDGSRNQHLGVDAQPGKVQTNLLPKILPVRDETVH